MIQVRKASELETNRRAITLADERRERLLAPLATWGFVATLCPLLMANIPLAGSLNLLLRLAFALNAVIFTIVGQSFLRTRFVLPVPILLIFVLQGWVAVSYIVGYATTSRFQFWGYHMYFLLEAVAPFFAAMTVHQIAPRVFERVVKVFLGITAVAALVSLAEFVRLPGTSGLTRLYANLYVNPLADGADARFIRPIGLNGHPGYNATQMFFGLCFLLYFLRKTGVRFWIVALFVLFSAALFTTQARAVYIIALPVVIFAFVELFKRTPRLGFGLLAALSLMFFSLIVAFPDAMSYAIGKDRLDLAYNISGRADIWASTLAQLEGLWLTGFGPDQQLIFQQQYAGRVVLRQTENVYVMMLAMCGIIGLWFFAMSLILAFVSSVRAAINREAESQTRLFAHAVALMVIGIIIQGFTSNMFQSVSVIQYLTVAGGFLAAMQLESQRQRRLVRPQVA